MEAAQNITFPAARNTEHPAVRYFIDENGGALESMWHLKQITLLLEISGQLMRMRGITDYYVGGDQFIYYPQAIEKIIKVDSPEDSQDCRGPDYFYVSSVDGNPYRKKWKVDDEGRYPDMIIELLSVSTARIDKVDKKAIYEKIFQTREYYWYDHDKDEITGHRLLDNKYRKIHLEDGNRIWCGALGVFLGSWYGQWGDVDDRWLRFYDKTGRLIPTKEETAKIRAKEAEASVERERLAKKDAESRTVLERKAKKDAESRAVLECKAKEDAESRAKEAEIRAKRAEKELAVLRALLSDNNT